MNKLLSVVMPVHNAEKYLSAAIESVLNQDFAEFELTCINDGSTDQSLTILKNYADRDGRIKIIDNPHRGLVASLNEGLTQASAPIVARMDADDICLAGRFSQQFDYLSKHPDTWVVGTGWQPIDEQGRELKRPNLILGAETIAKELLERCVICHPTVMMRRVAVLDIGGYREGFRHAEDYDLWLRVIERAKIDNLPFIGIRYRIHHAGVSEKHKIQQRISAALAQACHGLRCQGMLDPIAAYNNAPDFRSDKLLVELIPDHISFFRSILVLLDHAASRESKCVAAEAIEDAPTYIKKQNRKLHQEALFIAAASHPRIDAFRMLTFAAAVRLHPARFFKVALRSGKADLGQM